MTEFADLAALQKAVGEEIGVSGWLTVDQERIDRFAEATGDHQWIHVDRERAAQGPFGGTIAHGFLTLSLLVPLADEATSVGGIRMGINYGLNKVRFITPVPAGGRIRARVRLDSVAEIPDGVQAVRTVTIELEGAAKPACVAESIVRYLRG
ncbi:MaoC family dehydratase [Nocardia terpenica]|uniref:MaoC family dehydratase n=1 Tax=Nocardia terpenica TaxID=455432 RepID=UPI001894F963|nr:MaoC family dehydratase [Nocardia terpenica]MBF6064530.1 MaoC family dehydratase [Nocardia terpenica]MBF6106846.1 MaoC family dehydratase [Nocardia terpenica]MBF6114498.1 MaoC family dehydratase [Nocardia terpenica]MBF6121416.1 MaoC family dehydratase [Nocardia terpenica]MBF6153831.1 MaoC family dehydratase [Nocardia terpenica]